MALKAEGQQPAKLLAVFLRHEASGRCKEIVVHTGDQRVDVLLKGFRALIILRPGLIEQGIAVVKQRCGRGDGVRPVVDHEAEISVVPVRIADDGTGVF